MSNSCCYIVVSAALVVCLILSQALQVSTASGDGGCINAPGKCPGKMVRNKGQVSLPSPPKEKIVDIDEDACSEKCKTAEFCQMAMHLKKSNKHKKPTCFLYDKNSFSSGGSENTIFTWVCCKKEL